MNEGHFDGVNLYSHVIYKYYTFAYIFAKKKGVFIK